MRAAARLLLGRAEWSSAYYRLARYRTTQPRMVTPFRGLSFSDPKSFARLFGL